MHSKLVAVILGASFALAGFGAKAMPAAAIDGAAASPHVTLAAEGCGPGFARGPLGACRRIGPVVVVRPHPVVVVRPHPVVVVRPRRAVVVRPGCGVRVGPVAVHGAC